MAKKISQDLYGEAYTIVYDFQDPLTGFWRHGEKETHWVQLKPGEREKCNHDRAAQEFLVLNPGAKVCNVIYQ